MIQKSIENKQPRQAVIYKILKVILLLTIVTLPILIFFGAKTWFPWWYSFELFFGLPLIIWMILDTKAVSFNYDENKLEIKWGILFKKSRIILFNAIQNIKTEGGPLTAICGVKILGIWTASPSQINISEKRTENRPDALIYLTNDDAKILNDFIVSNCKKTI